MSNILFTEVQKATPEQRKALDWALGCCANASGLSADDARIARMAYQKHMLNADIAAGMGITQPQVSVALDRVERFLRTPVIRKAIKDGINAAPSVREDLYAYGIPAHIVRNMESARLTTITQLRRTAVNQIALIRHIGPAKIRELEAALAAQGITLPDTPPAEYLQEWQWNILHKISRIVAMPWELGPEHKRAFDRIFDRIPEEQRMVLLYRYRNGMSRAEIAERFGATLDDQARMRYVNRIIDMARWEFLSPKARTLIADGIDGSE